MSPDSSRNRAQEDDYLPAAAQCSLAASGNNVEIPIDNSSNEIHQFNDEECATNQHSSIGFLELLSYPKFFMAAASGTLGYFLYGFMEPILAFRVEQFDMT